MYKETDKGSILALHSHGLKQKKNFETQSLYQGFIW